MPDDRMTLCMFVPERSPHFATFGHLGCCKTVRLLHLASCATFDVVNSPMPFISLMSPCCEGESLCAILVGPLVND